ncbi:hypothetical protein M0802_016270 [Mischocyttarus mexicanus]|nr:hypothetical protein M0802_016270 [Mischocyttarus mexicanus]
MLRKSQNKVLGREAQHKVKEKSKQSDRQKGSGSKKILVWFSHGLLKDKTRFFQDKSLPVVVFVTKNIKRLRQGFLSKKLSKHIKRSRQGFLSKKLR